MSGRTVSGGTRAAARPGRRRLLSRPRRAAGLPGTLGVTALGALVPGAGLLWTRRRRPGLAVLGTTVGLALVGSWFVGWDLRAAADFFFDPARLQVGAGVLVVALVLWAVVVTTTYLLVRPHERTRAETVLGVTFVGALVLAMATPVLVGVR